MLFSIGSHLQTNGQIAVVNRTLIALLHALIKKNIRTLEECLPHVAFAYNRSILSTTHKLPFEVFYGFNPLTPLALLPLPHNEQISIDGEHKAKLVKQLHERACQNIERRNEQYS